MMRKEIIKQNYLSCILRLGMSVVTNKKMLEPFISRLKSLPPILSDCIYGPQIPCLKRISQPFSGEIELLPLTALPSWARTDLLLTERKDPFQLWWKYCWERNHHQLEAVAAQLICLTLEWLRSSEHTRWHFNGQRLTHRLWARASNALFENYIASFS